MTKIMKKEKKEIPASQYNKTAVYTGRRIYGKTVVHRFESDGNEMLFSKTKNVWIGATYKCGEKNISVRPERVVDIDIIDNPEWDAQDALVSQFLANKRYELKISKMQSPALKNAIEALIPLFKNLLYHERRLLIEFLANKAEKK